MQKIVLASHGSTYGCAITVAGCSAGLAGRGFAIAVGAIAAKSVRSASAALAEFCTVALRVIFMTFSFLILKFVLASWLIWPLRVAIF